MATKSFNAFVLFFILHGSAALLSFRFKKLAFSSSVGFRTNVPTVFQCAEICLSLKICKVLNFDTKNKICHISPSRWTGLPPSNYVLFAEKKDLVQELAASCVNHACDEYQFCQQTSKIHHTCIPYYQCLNGRVSQDSYCQRWTDRGGCDEANIGSYLQNFYYWKPEHWNYMQHNCKRSCRLCVEQFVND